MTFTFLSAAISLVAALIAGIVLVGLGLAFKAIRETLMHARALTTALPNSVRIESDRYEVLLTIARVLPVAGVIVMSLGVIEMIYWAITPGR